MIDAIMALWNIGLAGKVVKVLSAFLLICISLSLFLVTIGIPGVVRWPIFHDEGHQSGAIIEAHNLTATKDASISTKSVSLHPTPTVQVSETLPCVSTPVEATISKEGGHGWGYGRPGMRRSPTPGPSVRATQIATPTATVAPIAPPTVGVTATATATATPTDTIYPTNISAPPTPATVPASATKIHRVSMKRNGPTVLPRMQANAGANGSSGDVANELEDNGMTGCLGNNLAAAMDRESMMVLERHLEVVIAGSLAGTLLFYVLVFIVRHNQIGRR